MSNDQVILTTLDRLMEAASDVGDQWDHTGTNMIDGYPKCLPSWDEFIVQLREWRDAQASLRKIP